MPRKNKQRPRRKRGQASSSLLLSNNVQDNSFTVTLCATGDFPSIVSGTAASTVNWSNFGGFNALANFFQYFTPLTVKLDLAGYIPATANSLIAMAILPINWSTSAVISGTPLVSDMLGMRGTIEVQPGSINHGAKVKWPKMVAALGANDSSAQNAATIYFRGSAATFTPTGNYVVSVDCRFFRRNPFIAGLTPQLPAPLQQCAQSLLRIQEADNLSQEEEKTQGDFIITSSQYPSIQLHQPITSAQWVIEKNPGPETVDAIDEPEEEPL